MAVQQIFSVGFTAFASSRTTSQFLVFRNEASLLGLTTMALTALILAGLTALAFLLGIYLRPGASVFVLLPATLFCGLIAFVFTLASHHSLGWALAVALFPAIACQVGYAIGGLARSQETRAKCSTFGNDRSGGFTNDRVDALDGERDPPPGAPSSATMP